MLPIVTAYAPRCRLPLGIRAADLPEPGQTLPLKAMQVLAVVPGENWKREDVRREYQKLAQRIGAPRYLLTDGAVELRDRADVLDYFRRKSPTKWIVFPTRFKKSEISIFFIC